MCFQFYLQSSKTKVTKAMIIFSWSQFKKTYFSFQMVEIIQHIYISIWVILFFCHTILFKISQNNKTINQVLIIYINMLQEIKFDPKKSFWQSVEWVVLERLMLTIKIELIIFSFHLTIQKGQMKYNVNILIFCSKFSKVNLHILNIFC